VISTASREPTAVAGRRLLAFAVDLALFASVAALAYHLMATTIGGDTADAGCTDYQERVGGLVLCAGFEGELHVIEGGTAAAFMGLVLAVWFGYHGLLQGLAGVTVGKLLTGLRVVDREGDPCGLRRAFIRTLPLGLSWLVLGFGFVIASLVGAVMILSGRHRQRVGDRLARTYVVRVQDVGRPPVADAAA